MTEVEAIVKRRPHSMVYAYVHQDVEYIVEAPITKYNDDLQTGDKVTLALGILRKDKEC